MFVEDDFISSSAAADSAVPALAASDDYYYYEEEEEDDYREEDHGDGVGRRQGVYDSVEFDVGLWSVCPVAGKKLRFLKSSFFIFLC